MARTIYLNKKCQFWTKTKVWELVLMILDFFFEQIPILKHLPDFQLKHLSIYATYVTKQDFS